MRNQTILDKSEIVLVSLLFCAYGYGVFYPTLWSDDFAALENNYENSIHALRDGRPFLAVILFLTFTIIKSSTLAILFHALGLCGLIVFGIYLLRNLPRSIESKFSQAVLIGACLCLPSFQTEVHWAHMWITTWASLLSIISYRAWESGKKPILSLIGMSIVIMSYPPISLWIFTFGALLTFGSDFGFRAALLRMVKQIQFFFYSSIISYIVINMTLYALKYSSNERVKIVSWYDLPEKIFWLLTRPILEGFRFFLIDSPTPLSAFLTAFPGFMIFLFAILAHQRRSVESAINKIGYCVVFGISFFVLPLLHLIFSVNNQFDFRMTPSYSFGIAYLIGSFILKTPFAKPKSGFLNIFLGLLLTLSLVTVNQRFSDLIGGPYALKRSFFSQQLNKCLPSSSETVFLIIPPARNFPSRMRMGDFSMVTDLQSPWVPIGSLREVVRVENRIIYSNDLLGVKEKYAEVCVIRLELFRKILE